MCVCRVDLCVNVVELHIMREHPNYWELRRTITFHQILQCGSRKGVVIFCQTCEAVNGELKCVVFFMYCQFEGWCYEYWFMQSICTQGFMSHSAIWDLGFS
jgi:hypothetical protein